MRWVRTAIEPVVTTILKGRPERNAPCRLHKHERAALRPPRQFRHGRRDQAARRALRRLAATSAPDTPSSSQAAAGSGTAPMVALSMEKPSLMPFLAKRDRRAGHRAAEPDQDVEDLAVRLLSG